MDPAPAAPLTLDHVFVIVDGPTAAAPLAAAGLTVHGGRRHPGQGSENRCVFFDENFLELLFVVDEAEAEGNMLRLHERSCPIGFGLRGDRLPTPSAVYTPPYGGGQFDFLVSIDATMPLLFAMRPAFHPPRTWTHLVESDRRHPCGAGQIARLELAGPGAGGWPVTAPWLVCRDAAAWHLTVRVASAKGLAVEIGAHLTVAGQI